MIAAVASISGTIIRWNRESRKVAPIQLFNIAPPCCIPGQIICTKDVESSDMSCSDSAAKDQGNTQYDAIAGQKYGAQESLQRCIATANV